MLGPPRTGVTSLPFDRLKILPNLESSSIAFGRPSTAIDRLCDLA